MFSIGKQETIIFPTLLQGVFPLYQKRSLRLRRWIFPGNS